MSAAVEPVTGPGADLDDDLWGRVLLGRLSEPADTALALRVQEVGASRAAHEVISGRSPVRTLAGLRARLADRNPDDVVRADLAAAVRCEARIVCPGRPGWPSQLDDLGERAPLMLWVRGVADLRLLALRSIAVVGTRTATAYGEQVARTWSAEFVAAGCTVISGGAFGIDAAAHRGALAAGGVTVCVLACGVDVAYPRSHDALLAKVADDGVIVSESPPGAAAMRQRFLSRNRLIAALTRGTVVVEAALRSGAASTAHEADGLGRPVYAVPGPVTSAVSGGCHRMVQQGTAHLVTGADDVLTALGLASGDPAFGGPGSGGVAPGGVSPAAVAEGASADTPRSRPGDGLPPREARVFDAVPLRRGVPAQSVSRTAGLPVSDVVAALGRLQVLGLVRRTADGWAKSGGAAT
jgi:DNA processing protein